MARKIRICLIGAGVIGLSTALRVLETVPDVTVTVLAKDFHPHTTSNVAAGLWFPHCLGETLIDLQRKWGDSTFAYLEQLFLSEVAAEAGVFEVSGHMVFKQTPNLNPYWKNTVYNFSVMSPHDLKRFPGYIAGCTFTSFVCEGNIYLPWLQNRIEKLGGKFRTCKIHDLTEVSGEYDLLVNCSGPGARDLFGDTGLEAVRGQVVRVRAPWLKEFCIEGDDSTYLIPGQNEVVVGGTHQTGNWETTVCQDDVKKIWKDACSFIPSLKSAVVVRHWVGIRPVRAKIRLEREDLQLSGRIVPVVHNYGHGGAGITLHWGCALDATVLVEQAVVDLRRTTSKL